MPVEVRFSWTQPICRPCWRFRVWYGRTPVRIVGAGTETCVDCGKRTTSGIYYRIDPATAKFPTKVKD